MPPFGRFNINFIDFCKVFDTVATINTCWRNFSYHYEIQGNVHNWISSHILRECNGLPLRVIVQPMYVHVNSDVPQRTVFGPLMFLMTFLYTSVESGLDDPDNLGHLSHFFDESSGSHPQIKLFGCDPDITCWSSLENSVGIW